MIIVTGGAGFIGSNLVKALNKIGRSDIIVVDDLTDGHKFSNLIDCTIADYFDKDIFLQMINQGHYLTKSISAIFHQGACSTTTEWNGRYMMENNYQYSKELLHFSLQKKIPFLYASSAAVYGANTRFSEIKENEQPLNIYGYSKLLFDNYVRRVLPQADSQIVGLRYFNVYGPGEQHKGSMASVAYHFNNQLIETGEVKLFAGTDNFANGEQRRDFIFVDDITAVNLWFFQQQNKSGIFNLGTGRSQSFNDVANAVIAWHGKGKIQYISFPEHLQGKYQSFTEADLSLLRNVGYAADFKTVEQGVKLYLDYFMRPLTKVG